MGSVVRLKKMGALFGHSSHARPALGLCNYVDHNDSKNRHRRIIYHNGFHAPMFPLPYIILTAYIVDSLPSAPTRTPLAAKSQNKCKIIKRHTHTLSRCKCRSGDMAGTTGSRAKKRIKRGCC
jgi:hypothetical protein